MIRYTFKYESGYSGGCWYCGNVAVGVQTDRVTGEEYWVCKKHIKSPGFCRRGQLHPDFRKSTILKPVLHIKKGETGKEGGK